MVIFAALLIYVPWYLPISIDKGNEEEVRAGRALDTLLPESFLLEGNGNNYHNNEVNITSLTVKLLSCPKNALEK